MATSMGDFTEILIRQGAISPEQLAEADSLANESNSKVADALIRLGYATGEEVMRAMAQEHGLDYVELSEVQIPPNVVELVGRSACRDAEPGECQEGSRSQYERQLRINPSRTR